ncbi:MAG: GntR family transcriptional regulator [Thermodesulfobacteriota bacterium]
MDIIRRDMTPRYYKIYEELHKSLTQGKYKEGDRFPSEHELCQRYQVSRGTVREAMKLLFQEGLVKREQGRGSFVTLKHKIEQNARRLMGFTELMRRHGKQASAKLLEVRTGPRPNRFATFSAWKLRPKRSIFGGFGSGMTNRSSSNALISCMPCSNPC